MLYDSKTVGMRQTLYQYTVPFVLFLSLLSATSLRAQLFVLDGTDITSCSGNFLDSGSLGLGYQNNEDLSAMICPVGAGDKEIQLLFQSLDIGPGDTLYIYDGEQEDPNQLIIALHIDNQATPISVTPGPANPSGCMYVRFRSDGAGIGAGWTSQLSCVNRCQAIEAAIQSSVPAIGGDGILNLCPGEPLSLTGLGIYPENNIQYQQSDATSQFRWSFGNGITQNGLTVDYTYPEPGGYTLELFITDQQGCTNRQPIKQRVQVAAPPLIQQGIAPTTVCAGDTVRLAANGQIAASFPEQVYQNLPFRIDTVEIVDGSGITTESDLNFQSFPAGATLTDINDIEAICAILEHSSVIDLDISITCPSGQQATLYNFTEVVGVGRYLGEPELTLNVPIPGVGYQYCWTPTAPLTIEEFAEANDPNTLGVKYTIPAGNYAPDEALDPLVGCPLNGTWTLMIRDKNQLDNGFLFGWQIDFTNSLVENPETFQQTLTNASWVNAPTIVRSDADSLIAVPTNPGPNFYSYEFTDNLGCTFDTSVQVNVLAPSDPSCNSCQPMLAPLDPISACVGDVRPIDAALRTDLDTVLRFSFPDGEIFPPTNPGPGAYVYDSEIQISGINPADLTDPNTQLIGVLLDLAVGDLTNCTVVLEAPNGSTVNLWDGSAGGANLTDTRFTPTATTPITAGVAPFTGDFLPVGDFNTLAFGPINGTWKLRITRNAGSVTPIQLNNWALSFAVQNPIRFQWDPSPDLSCTDCPDPTLTVSQNATYRVAATDVFGCTERAELVVSLNEDVAAPSVACTATDASITFSWDPVAPNGIYETRIERNGVLLDWEGPLAALSQTVDNLVDGDIVQLEVRAFNDSNFCTVEIGSSSCIVNSCDFELRLTDAIPPSCAGGTDGRALFELTGDSGDLSLRLDGVVIPKNAPIENLAPGTYTLEATTPQGCSQVVPFTIDERNPISILANSTSVSCNGTADGAISVTVSGGSPGYQYQIDGEPFVATPNFNNLTAGLHTIGVRDRFGCTASVDVVVPAPDPITLQLLPRDPSCTEATNGSIESIVGNTTGEVTYAWSTNSAQPLIFGLSEGNYCLTVTDERGCSATACADLRAPSPLVVAQTDSRTISCNGGSDGLASVTVGGGRTPYRYRWDDPLEQIADTARFLTAGSYSVVVTDSSGCTTTASVTVAEPPALTLDFAITDGDCTSEMAGQVTALAGGGTEPFTFSWEDGSAAAQRQQLMAGSYGITVTDANGCTIEDSARVAGPPAPLVLDIEQTAQTCSGETANAVRVSAQGGAGSTYTYNWSTGASTATVTELPPGTYGVTVTDGATCINDTTIELLALEPIDFILIAEPPTCQGDNNGGMGVTQITGGIGQEESDYQFQWSNGSTEIALTNLMGGITYSVTVTDAQGCSGVRERLLREPEAVSFELTANQIRCAGDTNGEIRLTNIQGSNPELFSIGYEGGPPLQQDSVLRDLAAGTYRVIVSDAAGCQQRQEVSIGQPLPLAAELEVVDLRCFEGSDGSARALITGGIPPYTYAWSNGSQEPFAAQLPTGDYSLTVTDANQCTLQSSLTVNNPPLLSSGIRVEDITCNGGADGEIIIDPSGGEAPYNFSLDNEFYTSSNTFQGLDAGTYSVFVRDRNGCIFPAEVAVSEPPALGVELGDPIELLFGDSLLLLPTISNANDPVELRWREGTLGTLDCTDCLSPMATPDATTFIELTAIDANGCSATDQVEIRVLRDRQVYVPTAFSPNNDGQNDQLTVYGRETTQIEIFQVFDNWGTLVFEQSNLPINDETAGWDGIFRNQQLPTGAYVWRAVVVFSDGFTVNRHGSVMLVR